MFRLSEFASRGKYLMVLAHVSSLEDDNGLTRKVSSDSLAPVDSPRLAVHDEHLLGSRGRSAT